MKMLPAFGALLTLLLAIGCGDDTAAGGGGSPASGGAPAGGNPPAGGANEGGGGNPQSGGGGEGGAAEGGAAAFALTSTAYTEGEVIPEVYECENGGGDNISMPLTWTAGPAGTLSYAIMMRDLDFNGGFEHWAIWDIPGNVLALPEDVEHVFEPADPDGAKQAGGGYLGPCSPNSVNTYELTVYAIPVATIPGLDQNSSKAEAEAAIVEAASASATLSGES